MASGNLETTGWATSNAASITRVGPKHRRLASTDLNRLSDRFTAQQASLIRAVVLNDLEYLNNSFYVDPKSGHRVAYELEVNELEQFLTSWGVGAPECSRLMNQAIERIPTPSRRDRYIQAAVSLEVLMDRAVWCPDSRIYQGIPNYLMHGYTDMGSQPEGERAGREKIKVDKERMQTRLFECRRQSVVGEKSPHALISWFYQWVRKDLEFDELGVEKLARDFGNESIVLNEYLDKGLGVCRHLSIFFQLYAQEAGLDARLVKGDLRFYVFKGRHAWNLVRSDHQLTLVDVTHPSMDRPFIVTGSNEEDVYRKAQVSDRIYLPTPNEQNHFKIGAVKK